MNERDISRSTARRLTRVTKKKTSKRAPKDAAGALSAVADKIDKLIPKARPSAVAMERSELPRDTSDYGFTLAQRIQTADTEQLRAVHDFLDCDRLRAHYGGMIAEIRREMDTRKLALRSSEPFCACGRVRSECDGSRACCRASPFDEHEQAEQRLATAIRVPSCPLDASHLVERARDVPAWSCVDCDALFRPSSGVPGALGNELDPEHVTTDRPAGKVTRQ